MKLAALLLLLPMLASAQSWRLLPDGYVVGVHIDELREAYALRRTQDDRVRDFAIKLAAARSVITAQEERIGGLLASAKEREGLQAACDTALTAERGRADRAERRLNKMKPWATIGKVLSITTGLVGAAVLVGEVQQLTNR